MFTLTLLIIPILTALLVLLLNSENAKRVALLGALANFAVAVVAWLQFSTDSVVQFAVSYDWLPSAGIKFSVGMDGVSLLLVMLTVILVPVIILSSYNNNYKNPSAFYALILFMQTGLIAYLRHKMRYFSIFSGKLPSFLSILLQQFGEAKNELPLHSNSLFIQFLVVCSCYWVWLTFISKPKAHIQQL